MRPLRIRFGALLLLPAILAYLLVGLAAGGPARLIVCAIVAVFALAAAFLAPLCAEWLDLIGLQGRRAPIEALRRELGTQTSARDVAKVLATHLHRLTGAQAVSLSYGDPPASVASGASGDEPSQCLALELSGRKVGELRCHGPVRLGEPLARALRFGALALQNAVLAEQAALAERAHLQAQAQRDLQYRLTWTVTTQVRTLLGETRERLETVRLCAGTMPADLLARDLEFLADRLCQLEAFVHDNLRNANTLQGPFIDGSLAGSARPR